MKRTGTLALLPRKCILFLLILLSTSKSQTAMPPPAGLLGISDCETCPAICSSPTSPPSSSPPPTPKLPLPPPPSVQRYSPPQPYYYTSTSPSPPPAHRPPSPPSYISWGGGAPPPPSVYVYNPGMGQRNFSYPYNYFYASKAPCCLPLHHQGFISFMFFILFQVLYV